MAEGVVLFAIIGPGKLFNVIFKGFLMMQEKGFGNA